jgi:hypothetical protein
MKFKKYSIINEAMLAVDQLLSERGYPPETRSSAQRLLIELKLHHVNPRLPSDPNLYYKDSGWVDWKTYVGAPTPTIKYSTIEEAMAVIERLLSERGYPLETRINAQKLHKALKLNHIDPRLPSHPNRHYKDNGWIGWKAYVGGVIKYPTIEEAMSAVDRLLSERGYPPKTRNNACEILDILKLNHTDPRLPSHPNRYYKDSGWVDFKTYVGFAVPN